MAQATPGSNYTVQSGDTLTSIAQQAYGDSNQWPEIYNANTQVIGNDPNYLHAGQVLFIPVLSPSPTPGSKYTVRPGDTLFSIAQQAYGDGNQWPKIYDANKQVIGSDPNVIRPGEVLSIPQLTPPPPPPPPTPGSKYTVRPGDTLFSIAQHAYGDGNKWPEIYNANKQVIGSDPNVIRPGEVLSIPKLTPPPPPPPPQPKTCKVTASQGLNIRAQPTSQSALIASYPIGTVLNFIEVVNGENVNGNPRCGHSQQGHYFWMGGTDHPNG